MSSPLHHRPADPSLLYLAAGIVGRRGARMARQAPAKLDVLPLREGDELDADERAALHAAIEEAEGELDAGQVVSEEELWARLRAIP